MVWEKGGELVNTGKNKKAPCVNRYWKHSSELQNKTHAQMSRTVSETPRKLLNSADYEKNGEICVLKP